MKVQSYPPAPLNLTVEDLDLECQPGQRDDVERITSTPIDPDTFALLSDRVKNIEVGPELQ